MTFEISLAVMMATLSASMMDHFLSFCEHEAYSSRVANQITSKPSGVYLALWTLIPLQLYIVHISDNAYKAE